MDRHFDRIQNQKDTHETKRHEAFLFIKRSNVEFTDLPMLKRHLKSGHPYQIITASIMLANYQEENGAMEPVMKHSFEDLLV